MTTGDPGSPPTRTENWESRALRCKQRVSFLLVQGLGLGSEADGRGYAWMNGASGSSSHLLEPVSLTPAHQTLCCRGHARFSNHLSPSEDSDELSLMRKQVGNSYPRSRMGGFVLPGEWSPHRGRGRFDGIRIPVESQQEQRPEGWSNFRPPRISGEEGDRDK